MLVFKILLVLGIAIVIFLLTFIYSALVISSRCSREEEWKDYHDEL